MELPKDLVKEFASVTDDTTSRQSNETTCYGTARFDGGGSFVQLDGADTLTPATFSASADQGDRVLVILKGRKAIVIGNITNPYITTGYLKANVGIIVNGYLTTNESRTEYNDQNHYGLTFSQGGIGAYGGGDKYWTMKNDGTLYATSAEITGKITATSGTIGGCIIDNGVLKVGSANITSVSVGSVDGLDNKFATELSDYMYIDANGNIQMARNGSVGTVGAGTKGFQLRKDGLLQASDAVIYGTIYASAGTIGGLQIVTNSIHTNGVEITSNADNSIGLSSVNFARTINGTSRNNLRLAIGSRFGVTNTGKMYASDVDISGEIHASTGVIGGWNIVSDKLYKDTGTDSSGFSYRTLINAPATPATTNVAFAIQQFKNGASQRYVFYVDYKGSMYATSGSIGGWTIDPSLIYKDTATTDGVFYRAYMQAGSIGLTNGAFGVEKRNSSGILEYKFFVNYQGHLHAIDANIGGWTVTSTILYKDTATTDGIFYRAYMNANASQTHYAAFGVEKRNSSGVLDDICYVTYEGVLHAKGAIIEGTITANTGYIGGTSGWVIKAGAIYSGTNSMTSTTAGTYIGTDGIRQYKNGNYCINLKDARFDSIAGSHKLSIYGAYIYFYSSDESTVYGMIAPGLNKFLISAAGSNSIEFTSGGYTMSFNTAGYLYVPAWIYANSGYIVKISNYDIGDDPISGLSRSYIVTDSTGYAAHTLAEFIGGVDTFGKQYAIIRAYNASESSHTSAQLAVFYPKNGTPFIDTNCLINANGHVYSTVTSGEAQVSARNGAGSSNRILLWANSGNGMVGLYHTRADGTSGHILLRENNNSNITTGGYWTFQNSTIFKNSVTIDPGNLYVTSIWSADNEYGYPISSHTGAGRRIARLACGENSASTVMFKGQYGGTSYGYRSVSVSSSDIRLKENIKDCTISALPVINAIKMREFDWKDEKRHQAIGMVADELEEIDNNLSVGGGYADDGCMNVKSVDTFYLIGYLVKAVQELSNEINTLKGGAA